MHIRYFTDTDTIHIELTNSPVVDTLEFNEQTLVDLDADGNVVAITIEHAQEPANMRTFSFEQIPALQPQLAAAD